MSVSINFQSVINFLLSIVIFILSKQILDCQERIDALEDNVEMHQEYIIKQILKEDNSFKDLIKEYPLPEPEPGIFL